MSEEIKEKIKAYYIANDIDEILNYITSLQQKAEEKNKEIDRLKNIIDELEKWIEEHKQYQLISERYIVWEDKLVNKLKTLKENK